MLQLAIDKVLAGKAPPEHMTKRGNKVKEVAKR